MRNQKRFLIVGAMGLLACGVMAGCSSKPEMTESQRQDEILKDPMNYKPDIGRDVGGGDTGNFDQSGFNKDLKDTFDP